ncbi:MAG: sigma-70 family RNA polymerase sigma factor [Flavobacteriaceae bacterium]|jgi:RNA polymerase sigma-70 factor (ECF subfamily)|nr:sigma-70 family RNA polymerase sigma factor [Flavobacteriaceae bacterium]MBT5595883.1 sigma-70 family RNA polymerase sigma factor [Flavobacteriaceae bacterium]MBT6689706.1 sigma-70 family RNA polymerase sigma factor [Flavobacteriaceae bacterium]
MVNYVNDSVLLDSYKLGDNSSFETLFLRHKQRIFNYINSKVLDTDISNDILQDTFIKVFKKVKLGKYNEQGKFLPWVLRIAHNLVMDHFRTVKRLKLNYENDMYDIFSKLNSDFSDNDGKVISDKTLSKVLLEMIDQLPDSQKEIVKLRFYEDLTFKQIAEMNGISINTALGRIRYSINNLRKKMDKSALKNELKELSYM